MVRHRRVVASLIEGHLLRAVPGAELGAPQARGGQFDGGANGARGHQGFYQNMRTAWLGGQQGCKAQLQHRQEDNQIFEFIRCDGTCCDAAARTHGMLQKWH